MVVNDGVAVVTNPGRIQQGRRERVGPFQRGDVAVGLIQVRYVVQGVGLSEGVFVIHVSRENTVLVADLVVHADGKEIFPYSL